ncbi:MAG: ABC transporter ATP-binding protein [Bacteroidetes bacterium]|nr:ABC transporter ATP-binding protein [Bacteroidota bacterium]
MNIIEVNNLTKIYGGKLTKRKVTALDDFSLQVKEGNIFGLLGPNGAGKTTLIKVLLGIAFATHGNCKLFGKDIAEYKQKKMVGYLPENHRFPSYLTAEDVMKYFAALSGYRNSNLNGRIDELLKIVKMDQWKKVKVKKYSKGMMQRLGLAQAMLHDPKLIFLDEPTDGVDPIGRKEIREVLTNLKKDGKTIFLNSHLLSEVELVSDRVAILNKGRLLQEGSVEELTTTKETFHLELENEISDEELESKWKEFNLSRRDGKYIAPVGSVDRLNVLIDQLRAAGKFIKSVTPMKHSLEDMFISLINESEGR